MIKDSERRGFTFKQAQDLVLDMSSRYDDATNLAREIIGLCKDPDALTIIMALASVKYFFVKELPKERKTEFTFEIVYEYFKTRCENPDFKGEPIQ